MMSIFDESCPPDFTRKLLVFFGTMLGFRGSDEHHSMTITQITHGFYPPDHPYFPNDEWWGIDNLGEMKTHQLSLDSDYVFEWKEFGRFPVLSDGVNGNVNCDLGGALKRWMEKLPKSDSTNSFYCSLD